MKGDKSFLIFLIFLALVYGRRVRNPCAVGKAPCDNGECITRWDWCGNGVECTDESDEKYCDRKGWFTMEVQHICTEKHFTCEDGMCIPASLRCDFERDCYDGSDEQNCETLDQDGPLDASEKESEYFSTTNTPAEKTEIGTSTLPTLTTSTPAQRREMSTTALSTSTDFHDTWRTTSTPAQRREFSTTAHPTSTDLYNILRTTRTPEQRRGISNTAPPTSTDFYDSWRTTSTTAQRREISTTALPTSTSFYDNWRAEETLNDIIYHYYTPPLSNTYDPYAPPAIVNPNYNRGIPFYPRYPEQSNNRRGSDIFPGENFPNNWQPHVRETTSHGRPYRYTPPTTTTFRQNPLTPDYPYAGQEIPQVLPLRSILYPPRTTLIVSLHRDVRRPEYSPFYFANSYTPDFEPKYRPDIRNAKDWFLSQRGTSYGWNRDTPRGLNALLPFSNSFQSDVEDIGMMRKSLRTHLGVKIVGLTLNVELIE